ncbi:MAG: hypothetical protein ACU0AU_06860 [Cognatishimia activa]
MTEQTEPIDFAWENLAQLAASLWNLLAANPSEVFAGLSAIAAIIACVQASRARSDAIKLGAPYFVFLDPGIKPGQGRHWIGVTAENRGSRSAYKTSFTAIFMERESGEVLLNDNKDLAAPIPPGSPTPYSVGADLPPNIPAHFFFFGVKFLDERTGSSQVQYVVMKWDGLREGVGNFNFHYTTNHETQEFFDKMPGLRADYLK